MPATAHEMGEKDFEKMAGRIGELELQAQALHEIILKMQQGATTMGNFKERKVGLRQKFDDLYTYHHAAMLGRAPDTDPVQFSALIESFIDYIEWRNAEEQARNVETRKVENGNAERNTEEGREYVHVTAIRDSKGCYSITLQDYYPERG